VSFMVALSLLLSGAWRRIWADGIGNAGSQGRPAHPALERLYRQAGACIVQLGLLGVGAAAFADMRKEFHDA
jgi:hypothetical protein